MTPQAAKPERILSVQQIAEHPAYKNLFTEASLRALIHKARPTFNRRGSAVPGNGLLEIGAIIKLGRRVLIDLDKLDEWIGANRQKSPLAPANQQ